MRMRSITVDGKNAVAYMLGDKIVIAWSAAGDCAALTKSGTVADLAALESDAKHGTLKASGFVEVH